MRIESITSRRTSYNYEEQDVDFESVDQIDANRLIKDLEAVTQEIRVFSENKEKVNWLIGAYYYQEDMEYTNSIYFGSLWRGYIDALAPGALTGVAAAFGIPDSMLFAAGQGVKEVSTQDNSTTSIYAQ